MSELLPFLEISGPDNQTCLIELTKDRTTIGRFEVFNDIALEPDPKNPTFLQTAHRMGYRLITCSN